MSEFPALLTVIEEDKDRRKGKGLRFCLGEEFLAVLAILPRTIVKNRMN